MRKWLLISGCACSVTLSAATFTVTNNASAGPDSFLEAVVAANVSTGNDILFAIPSGSFTIALATPMPYDQSFTIDGTNSGNGFTLNTSTAQSITSASGVTTTMTNTSGTMAFNVVIAGAADSIITKTGAGTLSLSGTNTYGGGTNLSAGKIIAENNQALGTGPVTMVGGTTLDIDDGIRIGNAITITSGTAIISVDTGSEGRVIGVIAGAGTLAKTGAGILSLTGSNTYSVGTSLLEGSIALSNDSGLGSGTLYMADSTSLLSDDSSVSNPINITGNATVYLNY